MASLVFREFDIATHPGVNSQPLTRQTAVSRILHIASSSVDRIFMWACHKFCIVKNAVRQRILQQGQVTTFARVCSLRG